MGPPPPPPSCSPLKPLPSCSPLKSFYGDPQSLKLRVQHSVQVQNCGVQGAKKTERCAALALCLQKLENLQVFSWNATMFILTAGETEASSRTTFCLHFPTLLHCPISRPLLFFFSSYAFRLLQHKVCLVPQLELQGDLPMPACSVAGWRLLFGFDVGVGTMHLWQRCAKPKCPPWH